MTKSAKKLHALFISLTASGLLLASTASQGSVLDFNYNAAQITTTDAFGNGPLLPLGSSNYVSQGYGDVSGQLDVSYRYLDTSNNHIAGLLTWPNGYDDLPFAAWNGVQSGGDRAQVELASLNGSLVSLNSFNLGSWSDANGKQETVKVFELGNPTAIFEFTGLIGVNDQSNLFEINTSSTKGFLIEWTNPWWTGISNINHSVSAVPVPASIWLFASALAGLVGLRRRA